MATTFKWIEQLYPEQISWNDPSLFQEEERMRRVLPEVKALFHSLVSMMPTHTYALKREWVIMRDIVAKDSWNIYDWALVREIVVETNHEFEQFDHLVFNNFEWEYRLSLWRTVSDFISLVNSKRNEVAAAWLNELSFIQN